MRRRQKKKRFRIFIISLFLLFTMTIGYAAFNTNLKITSIGNIKTTDETCFTVADNGDGTLAITDYKSSCGTIVKIPETINNKPITKIADSIYNQETNSYNGSFQKKQLTKVIIPEGVKEIGMAAFNDNMINQLYLPDSIEKLGDYAFRHNKIEKLHIPNKYIEFGLSVFNDNSLPNEEAFIYKRNSDGTIDNTTLISYAGLIKNGDDIVIPDNVKIIDTYAFRAAQITGHFTVPDNVTIIKMGAFEWNNIESITIGTGVLDIESTAFIYNTSLKKVTINSPISTIIHNAFLNCPSLTDITINRAEGTVARAPWGAENATVHWVGTN